MEILLTKLLETFQEEEHNVGVAIKGVIPERFVFLLNLFRLKSQLIIWHEELTTTAVEDISYQGQYKNNFEGCSLFYLLNTKYVGVGTQFNIYLHQG